MLDLACLGLPTSLKSFIRPSFPASCLDYSHAGTALPLRAHAHFSSCILVLQMSRFNTLLPLIDHANLEAFTPPKDFAQPKCSVVMLGVFALGSSTSLRNMLHIGLTLLVSKVLRCDASAVTLDPAHAGVSLSPRSPVRLKVTVPAVGLTCARSSMSMLDFVNAGVPSSTKGCVHLRSMILVPGRTHSGCRSLASDSLTYGSLSSSRSPSCLELILSLFGDA